MSCDAPLSLKDAVSEPDSYLSNFSSVGVAEDGWAGGVVGEEEGKRPRCLAESILGNVGDARGSSCWSA